MKKKFTIEVSENQLLSIMRSCEFMARLYMGQTEELRNIKSEEATNDINDYLKIKKITHPELNANSYYSIHSDKIPNEARKLIDIHDSIRYFLAWDKADNTPETRRWPEQMQVYFDEVSHFDNEEELPIIKKKEIE